MKASTTLFWVINMLFLIGLFGAGSLVITEFTTGDGCPKFGAVPACLIILICFILPFISHLFKKWNLIYFLFTGIAALIALVASVMQFISNAECPKTDLGIPMCYISLLIFTALIILKKTQLNYVSSK
ncbi:hypothetical protein [Cellulophaga fucicola]|uniref:Uncharacterized protein n=1 Tax=Cellulophaga fucicola TaxID=76595 RepID=A0A1K1QKZ9_9FLAO|nr:hypothetical protein [Cellulophaga fucicola]SFW60618.1 hypothetical protein SAMN05660313_02759 [Cellulophaga fucicola]